MAQRREVALSKEQKAELEGTRDHHEKPYMRERAAAILKVAGGLAVREVAKNGLYKPRRRETVSAWISRYQQEGLAGLLIQSGRGRKPAFSPYG